MRKARIGVMIEVVVEAILLGVLMCGMGDGRT